MLIQTFALERLGTPTGLVLIVTNDEHRLRAVDWEDCESRMQRLLQRDYGRELRLRDVSRPSAARKSLQAFFESDTEAITCLPHRDQRYRLSARGLGRIAPDSYRPHHQLRCSGDADRAPTAARAVGFANGSNPIPIVVLCHRVIGADSSLTGFGGGLERKRWLLAHETKAPCCRETSPLATGTKSSKASRRAIAARDDPVSSNTSS